METLAKRTHEVPVRQAASGRSSLGWFAVVGAAATLLHWAVVVCLVELASMRPLPANVAGWLCAFALSFAGHHRLSFRGHGSSAQSAARRFLLVSSVGFGLNQTGYAVLLNSSSTSYALLLAATLASVAGATYAANRWWVFKSCSQA
jgi:putative flippase GtrA